MQFDFGKKRGAKSTSAPRCLNVVCNNYLFVILINALTNFDTPYFTTVIEFA